MKDRGWIWFFVGLAAQLLYRTPPGKLLCGLVGPVFYTMLTAPLFLFGVYSLFAWARRYDKRKRVAVLKAETSDV